MNKNLQKFLDPHLNLLVFGTQINQNVPSVPKENTLKYANYLYQTKNYSEALTILQQLNTNKWGILACEIMLGKYQKAHDTIFALKSEIELVQDENEAVEQRAWLLHWSLFVLFNYPKRESLLDLYLNSLYLNCIQYKCPWLLDYLSVAIVSSKSRKSLRDFTRILSKEEYPSDIKDLLLLIDNFVDISEQYKKVKAVMNNDYFMSKCFDQFSEALKEYVLQRYIKIGRVLVFEQFRGLFQSQDEFVKFIQAKDLKLECTKNVRFALR
jgi:translation initiation factor 3 subunit E